MYLINHFESETWEGMAENLRKNFILFLTVLIVLVRFVKDKRFMF